MRRDKQTVLTVIIVALMVITMFLSMAGDGTDVYLITNLIGGILPILFVVGVVGTIFGAKRKESQGKKKPTGTPSFRSNSKDHEHITMASIGHDKSHEMQQLDTMLEAGLIDNKEYQERLERIRKQTQNQAQQRR